jgi:hypothetical protein
MPKMNLPKETTSIETADGRVIWSAGVYTPQEIVPVAVSSGGTIENYGISTITNTATAGAKTYTMSGAPGKNEALIVCLYANSSDKCTVDMTSDALVANGTTGIAGRYLSFASAYATARLTPLSTSLWLAMTEGTVNVTT